MEERGAWCAGSREQSQTQLRPEQHKVSESLPPFYQV